MKRQSPGSAEAGEIRSKGINTGSPWGSSAAAQKLLQAGKWCLCQAVLCQWFVTRYHYCPSPSGERMSRTCPPGLSDMNKELSQPNLSVITSMSALGKGGNLIQPRPATSATAARERMRQADVAAVGSPSLTALHKCDVPPWKVSSLLHFTFLAIHQHCKSRAGLARL